MNRCNFSLIATLYNTSNAGFYNDIYFPIIKYAITTLFYQRDNKKEYYNLNDIYQNINQNFGLLIPKIVLKKVILKLEKSPDTLLTIYENGEIFQIKKAWDTSINEEIDRRTFFFEQKMNELEKEYQKYLRDEKITDDKKFVDFISDNTEDVLGFFENEDKNKIDEKYSSLAYFLQYLHKTNPDLFNVANQLFGGSIITGFLKRENPEIFIENNEKCEYFLDTSLVMSLLRLSTIEHETYAKEMLEVIKSSGNIPRVHPITLREIKNILLSVESEQGPRSNTEIESAYERYNLNPAKLAQIRCNLNKKVEDLGISVFPNSSEHDLNLIINEYQNKSIVKKLHRLRSYTDELFRDIHDIFMNDYIDKRRLESKRCHFVTLNTELINFCNKDSQSRKSNLIHPGKIVLELWMHNTKSSTSTIKSSILVETISRCMLLNNKSVREKLEIVSHYYNDRTLDFDPETYKGIILGLFRRDKKLMENINEMSKNEVNKQSRKNDVIIRKIIEEGKRNIQEIKENHAIFQTQLAELTSDNLKMKNIQKSLEEKQEKLQQSLIQERDSKNNFSNENKNLKENIQKQDVLINLYKEKDDISKNISLIEQQISILENERGKFVSYRFFYFVYFVLIVSILIFIICVAIYLYGKINPNENIGISNTLNNFIGGGAVVVAVADIIFNLWKNESNIFMPHVFKANIRKKQLDAWEITHPKYVQLQMDLEELKKQLTSVKEEIRKNHI